LIGGGGDAFLTPLVTWAFPNQAAIRARIGAADGTRAAALATWERVVLRALEEVETALSDYQARFARRQTLHAAALSSADAARRAQARHRLGADTYLVVVDAERARNAAAAQSLAAEAGVARAQLAVFRALGGGWQVAPDGHGR
jgi:outer membrane protein TolC